MKRKATLRLIGYARVSSKPQELRLQIDALKEAGCSRIHSEKVTGAKAQRPGLDKCLEQLQRGDVLVVWRLDRLGRSMRHLVDLIDSLRSRGIGFKSLSDGVIDTTTASGELVFHVFAAIAQFERRLIQERTRAGLDAARACGHKGGRPRLRIEDPRVQAVKKMFSTGGMSRDDICKMLKISRPTLYRYLAMV